MNDVTRILSAIEHGDPRASEELLPLVYHELRRLAKQRLAREKPGQTLQATALVVPHRFAVIQRIWISWRNTLGFEYRGGTAITART